MTRPPVSAPARAPAPSVPARRATAAAAGWRGWLMHVAAKPLVFAACLLPLLWLLYGAVAGTLGANPAEALIRASGDWTLRFICIGLAVTPLRVWTGTPQLARLRRMLGLFTFFYACLHLLCYAWFDGGFDLGFIAGDIVQRPFILAGFLAVAGLLLLAATSFDRAVRWLGGRRWRRLHRLVHAVALLGLLHFFWMRSGKNDFGEVAVYAAVIAVLLGWRAVRAWR